jgi:hypothetical protein
MNRKKGAEGKEKKRERKRREEKIKGVQIKRKRTVGGERERE